MSVFFFYQTFRSIQCNCERSSCFGSLFSLYSMYVYVWKQLLSAINSKWLFFGRLYLFIFFSVVFISKDIRLTWKDETVKTDQNSIRQPSELYNTFQNGGRNVGLFWHKQCFDNDNGRIKWRRWSMQSHWEFFRAWNKCFEL